MISAGRLVSILAMAGVLVSQGPPPATAQAPSSGAAQGMERAGALQRADQDLRAGRCSSAMATAQSVARAPGVMARADRAEAWRLLGLAQLCAGDPAGAEASFLELFRLDPDARLDPDLVPPDDVAFFERVRLENRDLIEEFRPDPPRKRVLVFNLLPPLGQFQNGHRAKGWVIAGASAALLAANVASFSVLQRWCGDDGVCSTGPIDPETNRPRDSRTKQARTMRTINTVTGVALVGTLLYGVADGLYYYRQLNRQERLERERRRYALGVEPVVGGAVLAIGGSF